VIGIAVIVFLGISVLTNRAQIETLRTDVVSTERRATDEQRDVTALRADVASVDEIEVALRENTAAIAMERAEMYEDLRVITRLAGDRVSLSTANHSGASISLSGTAVNVDAAYTYARALRNSGRFRTVWISPVSATGAFSIALTI